MGASAAVVKRMGVWVDPLPSLDHRAPPDVRPDVTEHGREPDDRPALRERVLAAEILVVGMPLRLGEEPSARRLLIERPCGVSGRRDDRGRSVCHGRVAGWVVAGDEDGIEHLAMTPLCAAARSGCAIPPPADRGWIGAAAPGASPGDEDGRGGRIGLDDDVARRNTTITTWNPRRLAALPGGGIPSRGDDRRACAAGRGAGHESATRIAGSAWIAGIARGANGRGAEQRPGLGLGPGMPGPGRPGRCRIG